MGAGLTPCAFFVSTRRVGWISVLASMPLPLAHTSTAQTPEGEITLSYRIEEAEFLLSLDTGWCERVTGLRKTKPPE